MQSRNVLLGKLWIWFSVIGLIVPALLICLFTLLLPMFSNDVPRILFAFPLFAVLVLGILSIPGIVVGNGLVRGEEWARIPAIILAVLVIGHFPVGTALAVFTFFVLFEKKLTRV